MKDEHPSFEQILGYVSGRMTDEESFALETHIATCPDCARRAKAHFFIKQHVDDLWGSWTATRHAEEFVRARLRETLVRGDLRPGVRERLSAWVDEVPARLAAALDLAIDTARRTARVASGALEGLRPTEGFLEFLPAPAPVRVRGQAESAALAVEAVGPPRARVTVDPVAQRVLVRMEFTESPWPLVILIPQGEGKVVVSEFRHLADTRQLLAEFEDMPPGEYLLLLEKAPSDEVRAQD